LRFFSKTKSHLLSPPHCFDTFPVAELRRERDTERDTEREKEKERAREGDREKERDRER
jgi:hypothetical protein